MTDSYWYQTITCSIIGITVTIFKSCFVGDFYILPVVVLHSLESRNLFLSTWIESKPRYPTSDLAKAEIPRPMLAFPPPKEIINIYYCGLWLCEVSETLKCQGE